MGHQCWPSVSATDQLDFAQIAMPLIQSFLSPIAMRHDRWRGGVTGKAFGLAISRSQFQILLEATLRNNLRQVVYTYVPLTPSSITWYRPKGGDDLRLGR